MTNQTKEVGMNRWAVCGALALTLGVVACTESDPDIVADANEAIMGEQVAGNIQVVSNDGVVTLTGTVPNSAAKERAAEIVGAVDGVDRVINNLRTAAGDSPAAAAPALDGRPPASDPSRQEMRDGMPGGTLDDTGMPRDRAGDAPDMRDAGDSMHDRDPMHEDAQDPMRKDETGIGGEADPLNPR
jgi:hypothetical protein